MCEVDVDSADKCNKRKAYCVYKVPLVFVSRRPHHERPVSIFSGTCFVIGSYNGRQHSARGRGLTANAKTEQFIIYSLADADQFPVERHIFHRKHCRSSGSGITRVPQMAHETLPSIFSCSSVSALPTASLLLPATCYLFKRVDVWCLVSLVGCIAFAIAVSNDEARYMPSVWGMPTVHATAPHE